MVDVAVYTLGAKEDCRVAIQIHGVFPNSEMAKEKVNTLAREGIDTDAFVLQPPMTWFVVTAPVNGTAIEEEEVAAVENENKSSGRMGSVCEVRKSNQPPRPPALPSQTESPNECLQTQRKRLDDLLDTTTASADSPLPKDLDTYSTHRERYALLCAFERKLVRLLTDAQEKCCKVREEAMQLENIHPEYKERYVDRYTKALDESGIPLERVGFMQYLREELVSSIPQ